MRSKEPVIAFLAAAVVALLAALTLAACGDEVTTTTTVPVETATTSAAAAPTTTGTVPTTAAPTTAASVSTTAAAPSTTTTLPAPTVLGTIAFTNRIGKGDTDICIVNTNGTGLTTIAGGEDYQYYPRWSPDGSRILYTEQGPESQQPSMDLWVVNADGSGKKELYDGPIRDAFATWSPDGKQIAWTGFTKLHNIGIGQPDRAAIFVMNADGSGVHSITSEEGKGIDWMPTWSPDGKIYFSRVDESGGVTTAFRVNPDGSGLEELRTIGSDRRNSLVSYVPSPDGAKAAFQDETSLPGILVVTAASGAGEPVALLDPVQSYLGRQSASPSWSPDGKTLAVAANIWTETMPRTGIFIVNVDGTGLSKVPGVENAFDPAWRPK